MSPVLVFFFQAEDGIRDYKVTGVQTCALPISERRAALLSFVIIGAGPTGVELAGTIADFARDTLPPEFREIDTRMTRSEERRVGKERRSRWWQGEYKKKGGDGDTGVAQRGRLE